MDSFPPNDPLPAELAQWQVRPPRNPAFRSAVWNRIESARRPATWTRFARMHAGLVTSLLAVAIAVGAWTGQNRAESRADKDRSALAATYVHRLDARWMRAP